MNPERELERHNKVLLDIENATDKKSLPKITLSNLYRYFCDNAYFETKLDSSKFEPVYESILETGFFIAPDNKDVFLDVLRTNYPGHSEEEYLEKYNKIDVIKVNHIIEEIIAREGKLDKIIKQELKDKHDKNMHDIVTALTINDLPKSTKGTLNSLICACSRVMPFPLKTSDIEHISDMLISGVDVTSSEIYDALYEVCENQKMGVADEFFDDFYSKLIYGSKVDYLVEEINAREDKVKFIYQCDHEDIMEQMKEARRISQLPSGLTSSVLSGYLSGNTIIYPKVDAISTTKLAGITDLLLSGKEFEDEEVKYELKQIAADSYPDNADEAYKLLYDKLSVLPKTKYLVEEINYYEQRSQEFIGRGASNVNVYFMPNEKSPIEGGLFYSCYINRIKNLNLESIVPLNLDEIVPKDMDQDAVEWYVQEYHDETFKRAGGIILNRDESIGNVHVFTPYSNQNVQIPKEEHSEYAELKDMLKSFRGVLINQQEIIANQHEENQRMLDAIDERLNALAGLNSDDEKGKGGR